jgi:hypothetical protein
MVWGQGCSSLCKKANVGWWGCLLAKLELQKNALALLLVLIRLVCAYENAKVNLAEPMRSEKAPFVLRHHGNRAEAPASNLKYLRTRDPILIMFFL